MPKTFATILLLGSAVAGFAQGTVAFSNGGLNKVSTGARGSLPSTWVVAPVGSALIFGLFYGVGTTQPGSLTFLSTALGYPTSTPGVFGAADGSQLNAVLIPGTQPNDSDVWVQVKGWSSSLGTDWATAQAESTRFLGIYFGQTTIVNAAGLGPSTGPGAPIWQTTAGTNPNKFPGGGFVLTSGPEPSTMTLLGLGLAAMLILRRRT